MQQERKNYLTMTDDELLAEGARLRQKYGVDSLLGYVALDRCCVLNCPTKLPPLESSNE